ncbi:SCP2 sterol-binding domain-containing protein [Pseudoalteromonas sp. KG3]|uniref:ubiquinone anaerobic biosynthesis accessory factor UbiT n=1 Tax=Pseudoalteromonas TaxID=53246 RepID=UPI002147CAEA|nr:MULTISPECIES: SCP2 sterol-binding domain-containing protein [Pseudoalteromonas]WKD25533.1 SCP2 sterol-binding domain-containing protein [Pseudoalteromonas sp. KG3]
MIMYFNKYKEQAITTVVSNIPRCAAHLLKLLPSSLTNTSLTQLLNRIFRDELANGQLDYLQKKWLKLEISDLQHCWFISRNQQGFIVQSQAQQSVTFTGKFNDFSLLAAGEADPDMLFFNRRLHISGETELGLLIKSTLENLEVERLPIAINFINQQHSRLLQKYGGLNKLKNR